MGEDKQQQQQHKAGFDDAFVDTAVNQVRQAFQTVALPPQQVDREAMRAKHLRDAIAESGTKVALELAQMRAVLQLHMDNASKSTPPQQPVVLSPGVNRALEDLLVVLGWAARLGIAYAVYRVVFYVA